MLVGFHFDADVVGWRCDQTCASGCVRVCFLRCGSFCQYWIHVEAVSGGPFQIHAGITTALWMWMTSLRALRRPGMSFRSALALHVNMTAALSPWMFRFELGALHQRSVANTSKMLWRRRGFNSQVEKQLIKTRRTYRKRKICTIFVMQEIGFGSYVDSLNSKATALSSLVEGFDTPPHKQSIPFACKWDSVLGDANPSAVTVTKSCFSVPGLGSSLARKIARTIWRRQASRRTLPLITCLTVM